MHIPTYPPVRPSTVQKDPVNRCDSWIRGVLIDIASDLQLLVSQSSYMVQDGEVLSFNDNNEQEINKAYNVSTVKEYSITDKEVAVHINSNHQHPIDAK